MHCTLYHFKSTMISTLTFTSARSDTHRQRVYQHYVQRQQAYHERSSHAKVKMGQTEALVAQKENNTDLKANNPNDC